MLHRRLIKLTGKQATDLITEKRLLRAREMQEIDVFTRAGIAAESYSQGVYVYWRDVDSKWLSTIYQMVVPCLFLPYY